MYIKHRLEAAMSIEAIIKADKPRGSSVMHSHGDSWEFILATEGEGAIIARGYDRLPFKPGTLTVIPPGVVHYNTSDAPYKQMAMRISTSASISDAPINVNDESGSFFCIFNLIFNAFYKTNARRTSLLGTLEDGFLCLVAMSNEYEQGKNPEIERMLAIINSNYTNPNFHIGDAISSAAYSEAHLRKLFLSEVGMTMSRYLNHLRLEHAKRILKSDGCSILTAAELSGFADFRYFARLFKEKHGITPSAWRSKSLRDD